jgi:uncharacterized protein (TIGR02118 family)
MSVVKMIAIFRRPSDIEGFMEHYEQVHLPIVRKLQGLRKLELNRMYELGGGDADPFLIAEMYFDSRESLLSALKSEEGRASGKDAQEFAGKYVQVTFADVESEDF